MSKANFDVRKYWDDRLATNLNLKGTGHRAFNLEYNQFLYQAQAVCLDKLLEKWKVDLPGKQILDVGCGTGFYINYFLQRGAGKIFGIDISENSIKYLIEKYPECKFFVEDISNTSLEYLGNFDFISVVSVLYHVLDDNSFSRAMINISSLCKPGGYILLSDALTGHWFASARHAHLRRLEEYQLYLDNFDVIDIRPIYFLLNHSFIPFLGPWLINTLNLGGMLFRIDERLLEKGWNNGNGMKFMLVKRKL